MDVQKHMGKRESKMDHNNHAGEKQSFFASRANIVFVGFLAIAGYFLITEHAAHIIPFLPWLLLLACPLMHFFMHGRHGGHGADSDSSQSSAEDR